MPLTHTQTTLEGDIRRFVRVNGEFVPLVVGQLHLHFNLAPSWVHCLFIDNILTYVATCGNQKLLLAQLYPFIENHPSFTLAENIPFSSFPRAAISLVIVFPLSLACPAHST